MSAVQVNRYVSITESGEVLYFGGNHSDAKKECRAAASERAGLYILHEVYEQITETKTVVINMRTPEEA